MVIYYSWSGNTRAYAEELAKQKGLPVFELKEKAERKAVGKLAFLKACMQAVMRKSMEVAAMPDLAGCGEIFVCTPIWASGPAPAVRFFIRKADLKDKTVHFLFTCGNEDPEVYKEHVLELVKDKGCIVGNAYGFFAKMKEPVDSKRVEENIHTIP